MRSKMINYGRLWTGQDSLYLLANFHYKDQELADMMGRSKFYIQIKRNKIINYDKRTVCAIVGNTLRNCG